MVKLKMRTVTKSKTFGNTYVVTDKDSGKEFTIDEYPKSQRGTGCAKYFVQQTLGSGAGDSSWRKTMTLKEAKNVIRQDLLAKVI